MENDSLKVLMIDDQKTMRKIIRGILSQVGNFEIDEAENGRIALDMLSKPSYGAPDVIISDLHMEKWMVWSFVTGSGYPKMRISSIFQY